MVRPPCLPCRQPGMGGAVSVGIITRATSTVDHLGVWAYHPTNVGWPSGRYVPLCARERDHEARWHLAEWSTGGGDGTRRKALCGLCGRRLTELHRLANRRRYPR